MVADHFLDAKGLNCPLPILRAKRLLNDITAGETLEVWSTDPGSIPDFQAFCRMTGHKLLEQAEDQGVFRVLLEKKA